MKYKQHKGCNLRGIHKMHESKEGIMQELAEHEPKMHTVPKSPIAIKKRRY